jgi:hypothetical protein
MTDKEYYESDLVNDSNIIFSDDDIESDIEDDTDTEVKLMLNFNNAQDILFDLKSNIEMWCEDNYVDILNLNLIDITNMNNKLYN